MGNLAEIEALFFALIGGSLDLVDEARDRLRPVKLNDNVLGSFGASADPARRSGAAASVQHVLDRVSRIL